MERKPLSDRLLQSAAASRRFLDGDSIGRIARFVRERQNRDGGFRGRDAKSDLYYTVFAVACLKALGYPPPVFKIWKYALSFGMGKDLDLVHLVCLIRLRTVFPHFGSTRRRLLKGLQRFKADSAYGLFLRLFAGDFRFAAPPASIAVSRSDPTTNLAAALMVGHQEGIAEELLARVCSAGGFAPSKQINVPDLLSTATALFALTQRGVDLDDIHKPCFQYVESLWRDSGGFAGHVADEFEDVEYTFYALLSIGCLTQSMAKNYGNR
ncbi:prenyltransferase/squalene oxidase repeat-containing protein [Pontiella sp.]|uniref:prenyltransferase/squalene oxidase repeat-containing protein n=1 Tax=Pontiella sp. TaxID=2837462 RepID=UPI003568D8F0